MLNFMSGLCRAQNCKYAQHNIAHCDAPPCPMPGTADDVQAREAAGSATSTSLRVPDAPTRCPTWQSSALSRTAEGQNNAGPRCCGCCLFDHNPS